MKKLLLTKKERERLELKFECIRRNKKYIKDYELQQEHKRQYGSYKKLESFFCPKWLHFPLLNPNIPIEHYRNKKNYHYWLEKTLDGLIKSDPLCPQSVKVVSPELKKYLLWKNRGYKTRINAGKGKAIKIPFPKGSKGYDTLDTKKVEEELRNVKLSLDLYDLQATKIVKQIEKLLEELKPLVNRILHKARIKRKTVAIRDTSIPDYLEIFDKVKKVDSWKVLTDDPYQKRKYQKQIKIAKILVNKGGWHYI